MTIESTMRREPQQLRTPMAGAEEDHELDPRALAAGVRNVDVALRPTFREETESFGRPIRPDWQEQGEKSMPPAVADKWAEVVAAYEAHEAASRSTRAVKAEREAAERAEATAITAAAAAGKPMPASKARADWDAEERRREAYASGLLQAARARRVEYDALVAEIASPWAKQTSADLEAQHADVIAAIDAAEAALVGLLDRVSATQGYGTDQGGSAETFTLATVQRFHDGITAARELLATPQAHGQELFDMLQPPLRQRRAMASYLLTYGVPDAAAIDLHNIEVREDYAHTRLTAGMNTD